MSLTLQLQKLLQDTLKTLGVASQPAFGFELPVQASFGDLSSNVAMVTFKALARHEITIYSNPRSWAEALVSQLKTTLITQSDLQPLITHVSVAGPGFINFTFSDAYWLEALQTAAFKPESLIPQTGAGQKAVVEYSSPNIAKPFTIGHLRSTIIGDAVANLLAATGWQVFRDNHLGDWGTQFGKQIYAIKNLGLGSQAANIKAIEEAENPVKVLVDLYVEFHAKAEVDPTLEDQGRAWFQKLETGDSEARQLWQKCIDWSLKEFKKTYLRLNITFTENPANQQMGYGESFFEDKMAPVIEELAKIKVNGQALMQDSKGARLIFFPDEKYPPLMVMKQDGATLYATRDLATDKWRLSHYAQDVLVINEVGAEQALYFQQLYETEKLAGWVRPGQRVHVKHGMYRFKDKKMSTRKGNVIWLNEVLDEAERRALVMAQTETEGESRVDTTTTTKIAIGALKWNDLKRSSHLDVVFDWDEILNLKGNSGPYVQYTYVRAQSILRKARQKGMKFEMTSKNYVLNPAEKTVVRSLSQFGGVVGDSARDYAPHHLATYLYELAQTFNSFYNQHQVLGDEVTPEQKVLRLQLTQAVAHVICQGLGILGIETVEKM